VDTYRSRVLRALSWSAGARLTTQALSMVFGILLARLLTPDDFGLLAMVAIFAGFTALLADVGLGSALVQKRDATDLHFNSVFWTNMALGGALTLALFSASGGIAAFFQRQELVAIVQILSLQFILGGLSMVQRQRLSRALRFKMLSLADLAGLLVAGLLAITLAWQGFGYWALVAQSLTQRLVSTAIIWAGSGWSPRLHFSIEALQEVFGFSLYVFATRTLQYFTTNVDKLITGRMLGGAAVGLLSKAQSIMLIPLQNISQVIGSVMFPALSEIQGDRPRVRSIYLRATRSIALLTFPMMTGIYAVADHLVLGLLGEPWRELVPILRILCFAGIATSIVTITGSIYLSQGASRLQLRVNLLTRPITIVCILLGVPHGLTGIATGATVATWLNSTITLTAAGRLIALSPWTLVRSLGSTLLAAVLMAGAVLALDRLWDFDSPLAALLTLVAAGTSIYAMLALLLQLPAAMEVTAMLRKRLPFRRWSEQ